MISNNPCEGETARDNEETCTLTLKYNIVDRYLERNKSESLLHVTVIYSSFVKNTITFFAFEIPDMTDNILHVIVMARYSLNLKWHDKTKNVYILIYSCLHSFHKNASSIKRTNTHCNIRSNTGYLVFLTDSEMT